MSVNRRQGQYAPKQNGIPQPVWSESTAGRQESGAAIPKVRQTALPVRPVTASKVSEEAIRRADEYVENRMTELTSAIKSLKNTIDSLPKSIPVSIPEKVEKEMREFKTKADALPETLRKIDDVKSLTDKWMVKGLFFVAAVVTVSILMATCAGRKLAEADDLTKAAEADKHYADSVLDEARKAITIRNTYYDFGLWMVDRYGTTGRDYVRFNKEYSPKNSKK